ncbi:hypothetical protein [Leptospira levettii]|uniref:hypothetical protein n=1 Tax=Leptospira levettii TaxID=2023178 RepID=UPI000C2AAE46|nr:hypothetical protein [Leptospira levettii]PJZ89072.1 hypothetical protein CH368_08585 [Leptospira levettii]
MKKKPRDIREQEAVKKLVKFEMYGKSPESIYLSKEHQNKIEIEHHPKNPYKLNKESINREFGNLVTLFTNGKYKEILDKHLGELQYFHDKNSEIGFIFLVSLNRCRRYAEYLDILFKLKKKFKKHFGIQFQFLIYLYYQCFRKEIDWHNTDFLIDSLLPNDPTNKFLLCMKAKSLIRKGLYAKDIIFNNQLENEPLLKSLLSIDHKNKKEPTNEIQSGKTEKNSYKELDSPYKNKHHTIRDMIGRYTSNASYDDLDD